MIGDSSWPFLHLNHLTPVVSPTNAPVSSTRAEDLAFPVDSADLSRQLEAWSSVKFAFDDEPFTESAAAPSRNVLAKPMAAQAQPFGPAADMSKPADYLSLDDPNPYSAHRMGTSSSLGIGPTHPLFAHNQAHAFRSPLPFDFSNPVYGGHAVDRQPAHLTSFPSSTLTMNTFMGTDHSEQLFSGMSLPYTFESNPAMPTEMPSFDGLDGLAGLAELASATSHAPVTPSEPMHPIPPQAPMKPAPHKTSPELVNNNKEVTPSPPAEVQSKASAGSKKVGNGSTPEDEEASRLAMEEDKRKRNTAASARFRIKKKLREQAVERTATELRERVSELEKEIEGLKRENGWLRGLIIDRATKDPKSIAAPASSNSSVAASPPSAASSISASKRPRRHDA